METKTFVVPNIGCAGCVKTVEATVKHIDGVQMVQAVEATQQVTVQWTVPATWSQIQAALTDIDYAPATN